MTVILPLTLAQLKKLVLERAGIGCMAPGECKQLALDISSKTRKQISDTTLKRVYGFACSSFNPSLFTLNALAEYSGYNGWEAFCEHDRKEPASPTRNSRLSLAAITRKISRRTLETLMTSSGIPPSMTVKRDFIDAHLSDFLSSGQPATLLTAPAGYGKTIGLCHWANDWLKKAEERSSDDHLLFVSSKGMSNLQAGPPDISSWLSALLGFSYEESDLAGQLEEGLQLEHHFYLLIDGFDKERFRPEVYEQLTELLLDLIGRYRRYSGFKLVLTMRWSNWIDLQRKLSFSGSLENWHLGFMPAPVSNGNMLPLSGKELQAVCSHLDQGFDAADLSCQAIRFFGYPLALQYYYQWHRQVSAPLKLDLFSIYETISSYFLDKIYSSRLAADKLLFIDALLEKGGLQDGRLRINKMNFYTEIRHFHEAYHLLLGLGFLLEVNDSQEGRFSEIIEIPHRRIVAYCLARRLVLQNNERYDRVLLDKLQSMDKDYRKGVLQWLLFNAIKVKQLEFLSCLPALPLGPAEKAEIFAFLSSLLHHHYLTPDETGTFNYLFGAEGQHIFYYTGWELLGKPHDELLYGFLQLQPPLNAAYWIHLRLAMSGLSRLDRNGMEKHLSALHQLQPQLTQPQPFNPIDALETLYNYLCGLRISKAILRQLKSFCLQPPAQANELLTVLALHCLKLVDHPCKFLRWTGALEAGGENSFFLLAEKAAACLDANLLQEAEQLAQRLSQDRTSETFTPHMLAVLEALQLKLLAHSDQAGKAARKMMQPTFNSNYSLYPYVEWCLLTTMMKEERTPEFVKHWRYRLVKLNSSGGFCLSAPGDENLVGP